MTIQDARFSLAKRPINAPSPRQQGLFLQANARSKQFETGKKGKKIVGEQRQVLRFLRIFTKIEIKDKN